MRKTQLGRSAARLATALVAVAGIAGGIAGTAQASTTTGTQPGANKPAATGSAQNCTLLIETGATQCFRTLTEAVSHVTGGRVTTAPDDARKAASDQKLTTQLNSRVAAGQNLVIGIQYYWENFGQSPPRNPNPTLVVSSNSGRPCTGPTGDVDYQLSPLPNFEPTGGHNWNNNIRSVKAFNVEYPAGVINYNNCYENLYDDPGFGGASTGYLAWSADLGAMRDRAESIRWS